MIYEAAVSSGGTCFVRLPVTSDRPITNPEWLYSNRANLTPGWAFRCRQGLYSAGSQPQPQHRRDWRKCGQALFQGTSFTDDMADSTGAHLMPNIHHAYPRVHWPVPIVLLVLQSLRESLLPAETCSASLQQARFCRLASLPPDRTRLLQSNTDQ